MADLQELIAVGNKRADQNRVKALGKRFGGLRTREEKVRLLLDELTRFEAAAGLSLEQMRAWRPVQAALKVCQREYQGG